ncbi:MAG: class I SAM-dependent methyltransferase [Bacteroidales bacterium]|nr:class I SAM-dependent methyltransferase [Bacteroidales bacterium]
MSEYETSAKHYDSLLFLALHRLRKQILKEVKSLKPEKLIDLCCGTGNQLKILHRKGIKNTYGVDISEDMLAVAAKGSGANCKLEDATATSYQENEFDVAIISFALHEKPFEVAQGIVAEALRLVKEGGKIIIVDYVFDNSAKPLGKKAVTFIEQNAGDEHYANFMAFNNYGGLAKLIDDKKIEKEKRYHFGATVMRIYKV